jgi:hypothetical protein
MPADFTSCMHDDGSPCQPALVLTCATVAPCSLPIGAISMAAVPHPWQRVQHKANNNTHVCDTHRTEHTLTAWRAQNLIWRHARWPSAVVPPHCFCTILQRVGTPGGGEHEGGWMDGIIIVSSRCDMLRQRGRSHPFLHVLTSP